MEVRAFQVVHAMSRLDQGLVQQCPEFSRSRLQKLIQQGCVQVNQQVQTDKNYLTNNEK